MPYVLWILQILLGLLFLFSGSMKFVMSVAEMTKDMPWMPIGPAMIPLIVGILCVFVAYGRWRLAPLSARS